MEEKSWNNEILVAPVVHKLEGERWVRGIDWGFNKSFAFGDLSITKRDLDPKLRKKKKIPKFGRLQLAIFHNRFSSESFIKVKVYINYLSFCPSRTFKVDLLSMLASSGIICGNVLR